MTAITEKWVRQLALIPEAERLEYWKQLVRGSIRGVREDQVEPIAKICASTERESPEGSSCGTWHAAATFFDRIYSCHCARCSDAQACCEPCDEDGAS